MTQVVSTLVTGRQDVVPKRLRLVWAECCLERGRLGKKHHVTLDKPLGLDFQAFHMGG